MLLQSMLVISLVGTKNQVGVRMTSMWNLIVTVTPRGSAACNARAFPCLGFNVLASGRRIFNGSIERRPSRGVVDGGIGQVATTEWAFGEAPQMDNAARVAN